METRISKASGLVAIFTKTICILWGSWVTIDYLANHAYITRAIVEIPYFKFIAVFLAMGLGAAYYVHRQLKKAPKQEFSFSIRGITLFVILQIVAVFLLLTFSSVAYLPSVSSGTRIGYFLITSTGYALGFFLIITFAFALGQLLFRQFKNQYPAAYSLLCIALGFSIIGVSMSLLGLFQLLHTNLLWGILAAIIIWQYKAVGTFLYTNCWAKRTINIQSWWMPLAIMMLFLILGINWIGAFKAFPIGYDGSALYMNKAALIAQSNQLPAGGQAFNWSVVMSLGQLLFDSRMMAILFSHLMNIFCLFAIYRIARFWLSPAYALLAALIPFSSPYFSYHSIVDEKIDLGFTFIVLSSFILLFKPMMEGSLAKSDQRISIFKKSWTISQSTYLLLLTGWLCGFAFGIKYTAILYLMALACMLFYQAANKLVFAGFSLFSIGFLFVSGIYHFGYIPIDPSSAMLIGFAFCGLGLAAMLYHYKSNWQAIRQPILQIGCIAGMFLLAYSPWAVKHLSEHKDISLQHLIEGRESGPQIQLQRYYKQERTKQNKTGFIDRIKDQEVESGDLLLPPSKQQKNPYAHLTTKKNVKSYKDQRNGRNAGEQAAYEEIKRYIGYENGLWLYSSIPYDMSMNTNIPEMRFVDLGFLLLLFLPLLLFIDPKQSRPLWLQLVLVVAMLLWLGTSYHSIYAPNGNLLDVRAVLSKYTVDFQKHPGGNTSAFFQLHSLMLQPQLWLASQLNPIYKLGSSIGFVGTLLSLCSLLGGFYFLSKNRLQQMPGSLKAFSGFLLVYLLLWVLMGNAIIWYAMPLFVLLPIVIIYAFNHPESWMGAGQKRFTSAFFGLGLGLLLCINTLVYFTSGFPGDNQTEPIFRWPFADYISNPAAKEADILKYFNPVIADALKVINANNSDKTYRVNTHFGFHIKANNRRVYSDPALETFDNISKKLEEESQFFDVLKANDFKYILLDLRTANADKTPEQSLRKKFIRLADQLLNSHKVQLLLTDNYVEDLSANVVTMPNGQKAKASRALTGRTIYLGNIALFEIL